MPVPPKPDFVKTLTDKEWASATLSERALHVARSQVGVEEVPRGSNDGPMIRLYLKAAGILGPAYWCAAFLTWCLIQAGADRKKLPRFPASTYWWYKQAGKLGACYAFPKRGRAFVVNNGRSGHIGLCRLVTRSFQFETIEGNTNDNGSRNGYAVMVRKRNQAYMLSYRYNCFIDLEVFA